MDRYRRGSSLSGPSFGPGGGFAAHSDGGGFHPPNDMYNGPEVSGPPPFPPPNGGLGGPLGGPYNSNMSMSMSMPNTSPPLHPPQSYLGGPGSFPPPGMSSSFPMGNSEPHQFPHDSLGYNPMGHRAAYSNSYDGSPLTDTQFPPSFDDGYVRGRTLSAGGGFGPPALLPPAPPMTPYHSGKRMRRASSVGPGMGIGLSDSRYLMGMGGRLPVKFRLSGEAHSGISVMDALDRVRLSQGRPYMLHDMSPDHFGKITLKVRWNGYHSNTYSIPLSTDHLGYLDSQSLARRTARAIAHFMQNNHILLTWDRVVIHRLEETRPGIWIPVLTTH